MAETEDQVSVAVVNFHAAWGDRAANLRRIGEWTDRAAGQGAQIVLFPETALTGYNTPGDSADMQRDNAVALDSPQVAELVRLARDRGLYLIVGLPERDAVTGTIYNAALVAGPDGLVGCYRKLHPAGKESLWAAKGAEPMLFDTRWGPVGLAICYDVYQFPEVVRFHCAMGARLCLNATAMPLIADWRDYYYTLLRARVIENGCFLASANLVGEDRGVSFPGGSLILGPSETSVVGTRYYADPLEDAEGMRVARLDLSIVDRARRRMPVFTDNALTGEPDWRPDLYDRLLRRVRDRD